MRRRQAQLNLAGRVTGMAALVLVVTTGWAMGQSSSLFLKSQTTKAQAVAATTQPAVNGTQRTSAGAVIAPREIRNPVLLATSLTAVPSPERQLIRIGDFVSVVVRHRLNYQSTGRNQQNSKWDVKSKLSAWFRISDNKLIQQDFEGGTPEVNFKNENKLQNNANFDRKDAFETRVMAKIIDVKPNGNLIIMARQSVKIDSEDQYVELTGECNKSDIGPNKSITSDKIFDLNVRTSNDGEVRHSMKAGWLKGGWDRVKPF